MIEYKSPKDIASILYSKVLINKKKVLWVGSGLSLSADYPNWKKLIFELCQVCGLSNIDTDQIEQMNYNELLEMADECKKSNQSAYETKIGQLFGGEPVTYTRQAYFQLIQLEFTLFITTNFDPLLAKAGKTMFRRKCRVHYYPDLNPLDTNDSRKEIFYIHGGARINNRQNGRNLILAKSEYDEAYNHEDGPISIFLKPVLQKYPIIIFGSELREEYIKRLFKIIRGLNIKHSRPIPQHFIILPIIEEDYDDEPDAQIEQYSRIDNLGTQLKNVGIDVLWYKPKKPSKCYEIEEILEIMQELDEKTEKVEGISTGYDLPI